MAEWKAGYVPIFAVVYRYSTDSAARDEHRPAHRQYLRTLYDAGQLLLAGPLGGDGPPSALLIFDCDSSDQVVELLNKDPFHDRKLVIERAVRPMEIVVGSVG